MIRGQIGLRPVTEMHPPAVFQDVEDPAVQHRGNAAIWIEIMTTPGIPRVDEFRAWIQTQIVDHLVDTCLLAAPGP
ncbi:hypothetical protein JW905_16155 [bacterium]|nr:hypothetical protein [candidate division CSSED10-310 bacterium]